ncbi:MAG: type I-U CRISPR-associated protein Csb2 [Acidobacteria bacterium]|nr:type I-U CRISPR-associated protein Csb2 [Acidobacteriota bacterium]MDW7983588.1 type I-U CRISPR-associated protein Csb2 [Acidobacteriota bacterium]
MRAGTVIHVELLSGRYHAHPWGEAQFGMAGPEWPPSPWRLLRALAAAWFTARPKPSSEAQLDDLLETLGRSDPPELWLPRVSFHECRYYQPVVEGGKTDRVLHHDFFAVPEGGAFCFKFHVDLSPEQKELLRTLLGRIRYFGRSESRARLSLKENPPAHPPDGWQAVQPREKHPGGGNFIYRRVLWTTPEDFKASDLWQIRDTQATQKTRAIRKTQAIRETQASRYNPPHLVDSLIRKKMPLPSGTRWVEYALPADWVVSEIRPAWKPAPPARKQESVYEVRFRLSRRIPIPVASLVQVARAFREEAVRRHRSMGRGHSRVLTGREEDGSVMEGHRHLYYLPQLKEGTLWVESLIVAVPDGWLWTDELEALLGVERIYLGDPTYPITVVVEEIRRTPPPRGKSAVWRSATPFLMPLRHRRSHPAKTFEEEVAEWIERLGGVRPQAVSRVPGPGGSGVAIPLLAHQYRPRQASGVGRSWRLTRRLGFWLRIAFAEPLGLPFPAIGADAHFGAGQWSPITE